MSKKNWIWAGVAVAGYLGIMLYSNAQEKARIEGVNSEMATARAFWVYSSQAGEHVGEVESLVMIHAYCNFFPDVAGAPTFCGNAPYPNQTFTFVLWGVDATSLDGECLIARGLITEYRGVPQIEIQEGQDWPASGATCRTDNLPAGAYRGSFGENRIPRGQTGQDSLNLTRRVGLDAFLNRPPA
jgi:hypothetical protein